jgi:hypothetical protein
MDIGSLSISPTPTYGQPWQRPSSRTSSVTVTVALTLTLTLTPTATTKPPARLQPRRHGSLPVCTRCLQPLAASPTLVASWQPLATSKAISQRTMQEVGTYY